MADIKLTQNKYTLVDDKDFEWLNQWKWYMSASGYVVRSVDGGTRKILMHRFIVDTPEGMDTDHINRDKLDNRRSNLKVCSHYDNMQNRRPSQEYKRYKNNKTGVNGVVWSKQKGKWQVIIQVNKVRTHYGFFSKIEDALTKANTLRTGTI